MKEMKRDDPHEAAKRLVKSGFTIARYEKLQAERNRRLVFFEGIGIPELINTEKELIAYGQEVLDEMTVLVLKIMLTK